VNVPFVDLKAQYCSIKDEIDKAIQQVLDSTAFAGGPFVERFEKNFAAAHHAKYCVAVSSGTAALHVVMMALGLGPGDEVVVPTNTFIATAEAISLCGATPVFVDCHPSSYNLDPAHLEAAITEKTRGVIAVHLYGQAADLDAIKSVVQSHGLWLVEDCAQAHLALYRGRPVGTDGIAGCFSFYPGKNLGAYGEGGAVTTNDQALFRKLTALRNHGSETRYLHEYLGHNYRMDGIQGAVLDVKLRHLHEWTQRRIGIAGLYRDCLQDVSEITLPAQSPDVSHVYHLFAVRVPERNRLMEWLGAKGIATGIHYPVPCHLQKAYEFLGYGPGTLPVSEAYASQLLSLPMCAELDEESVKYVCEQIRTFYKTQN
jgi:dTDP-4-amino-4,6-dideoxygalactose transaminase